MVTRTLLFSLQAYFSGQSLDRDGLKADKAEEDQELKEPPQDGQAEPITPEEAAELEEPQTPRTRPREGEEPLDLFSRLPVRRRIARTNFGGSPKRESFRK